MSFRNLKNKWIEKNAYKLLTHPFPFPATVRPDLPVEKGEIKVLGAFCPGKRMGIFLCLFKTYFYSLP